MDSFGDMQPYPEYRSYAQTWFGRLPSHWRVLPNRAVFGEVNPDFFHHLFRTPTFAKEAERWSYGITSDMWSLRPEHFKAIYVPIPPLGEQSAVVRFLAALDRRVNRIVRAKRRLIELLTEQ